MPRRPTRLEARDARRRCNHAGVLQVGQHPNDGRAAAEDERLARARSAEEQHTAIAVLAVFDLKLQRVTRAFQPAVHRVEKERQEGALLQVGVPRIVVKERHVG